MAAGVDKQPLDSSADGGDEERQRLLAAAVHVLKRGGWWGFKVESVLKQASLSTRSFYRHFDTKNDLLWALLDIELQRAEVALREQVSSAVTPTEKVDAYLHSFIEMARRDTTVKRAALFAMHWIELLPGYAEALNARMEAIIAPLSEVIAAGSQTGDLVCDDPIIDARAIFYLVASTAADEAALRSAAQIDDVEREVLAFAWRALGRQPPR